MSETTKDLVSRLYFRRTAGLREHTTASGELWFDGCIYTDDGLVAVYHDTGHLRLTFVRGGMQYERITREDDLTLTPRAIARRATQFAKEVTHG